MAADISPQAEGNITIEIAYASKGRSCLLAMQVPVSTTVQQAYQLFLANLEENGDSRQWLNEAPLGIFGQRIKTPESRVLEEGDRIEVYAPLEVDPKAARRARAAR